MEKNKICMNSQKIIKHFCCISIIQAPFFQLFPNREIIPYMKFLKRYGNSDNMNFNTSLEVIFEYIKDNKDFSFDELFVLGDIEELIMDNEFLIFEFPEYYPEEELFYFKLKYC